MFTISILPDESDANQFAVFLLSVASKLESREVLGPPLVAHLDVVAARARDILADHSKSGALAGSLQARMGSGDRPGRISAFAAATATTKELTAAWDTGRSQQKKWSAKLKTLKPRRKRRMVFYADFVEKGHRMKRKNVDGELRVVGYAKPVRFAAGAFAEVGESEADAAAEDVLKIIWDRG